MVMKQNAARTLICNNSLLVMWIFDPCGLQIGPPSSGGKFRAFGVKTASLITEKFSRIISV